MPPTALINSIESVRRRARWLSVAYGVGIVFAAAIGLLVAVVVVDYVLNLRSVPRVLAMIAALGTLTWMAYRYVARPAVASLTLSDVAGRLEKAFPQFEDRLRSTVHFADGTNPGSTVLQQRVIEQATQIAGSVNLSSAVVAKPAMVSVGSALGALLAVVLIASLVLDGKVLSIITSRLLTPFSGEAWPRRVQIDLTEKVPARVPVGQKIEVAIKLARGDKPSLKPILYYQLEGGPREQVFMTRAKDGQFRASLDARLEQAMTTCKLSAWIEAGDDRRDLDPITIVQRLNIRQIVASVTPPAYVPNRVAATQDLASAPVVTAEGSELAIAITFSKALALTDPSIEPVNAEAAVPAVQWSRKDEQTAVAKFRADAPLRFRVRANDADGFTNTALEEYELVVKPDANLSLQLENPRKSEERTAAAFVPLQAAIEDDCGVEWVTLLVERMHPSPKTWEIPLVKKEGAEADCTWEAIEASSERVRYRLTYKWELGSLKLNAGDVIEYQLRARDNFDLSGKRHEPVSSQKLRITVISQEDLAARVTDELRAMRTQVGLVRQTEQRTKQETQSLADDTKAKDTLDTADRTAAERLSQQQASAASASKQLATRVQTASDRLAENRSEAADLKELTDTVRKTLDDAGEGPMKQATQRLTDAAQSKPGKAERNETLAKAQEHQQEAITQLDRALAKLENIGSLQSAISEISSILNEQRNLRKENETTSKTSLGKTPEQMKPEDREKLTSTADKQGKLATRTSAALEKMAKQGKQMEKSDPSASEAMKSASQKGQNANISPSQQRASDQTRQNQQAGAQQSQQMAELGLETVLAELKEAERRELARLREQLAKLQEQVAMLVRRQSGHNIDNVLLQGPGKLASIDPKTMAELTELSQRKPDSLKAPEARQLNSGQELTERNARDLGKTADASPQTAEIGATLTRAAGKMERAIVSLRASALEEAYSPPQVEALATLIEAKNQVDEQKRQADKKAADQQREAIRARFEKLKQDQEKINADTVRVDKARDKDGNILRTEWPTIARLPKDQGALAEESAKIDEDLEALGSVVYIYANRDIKNTMDQVKDDLAGSKTGIPTQSEQTRIVEQLAEMIKNLTVEPLDKKFENANSGGGGGGGGKKSPNIPSEVELLMLKSLQSAVNNSTKRIDAAPVKDTEKLLALGARQGDMRNLLDRTLQQASKGEMQLGPEPDNKNQLPEEANEGEIEQKEVEDLLLGDGVAEEKVVEDFKRVGTRMARSRQRLAINSDPGKVTQTIQERIQNDLDVLIELARKQRQQGECAACEGQQAPKPGDQKQAQNQGKNQQANQASKGNPNVVNNNSAGAGSKAHDLKDIRENASEWGKITPRVRDAVIESKGETVIEQYRKLIDDYYEALARQGSRREP